MAVMDDFWRQGAEIGVFSGIPVDEIPAMPWDQVMLDTYRDRILVGEVGHLRWLLLVGQTRQEVRRIFDDALEELRQDLHVES